MALLIALAMSCASALAQNAVYPSRMVRVIVPFPPGGGSDLMTRAVTEKLSAKWGQPVIIENRSGANGNIGAEALSRAEPDGHTLMSTVLGPLVTNQFLYKNVPFDPAKFVAVSLLGTTISVLAVKPNLAANSVQELIALAKAQPGRLAFASQGVGSTSHLTGAMFQQMAGVNLLHIPYKGEAPALADLMGGQVDLFFGNISGAITHQRAGKLRIIAVAGHTREAALPNVPTLGESGLPGFFSTSWVTMVGPEKMPNAIAQQLSQAIGEAMKLPDVRELYAKLGADPIGSSAAEAAKFLAEERARWRKVIEQGNVRIDQ